MAGLGSLFRTEEFFQYKNYINKKINIDQSGIKKNFFSVFQFFKVGFRYFSVFGIPTSVSVSVSVFSIIGYFSVIAQHYLRQK